MGKITKMKTTKNLGLAALLIGATLTGCAGNRILSNTTQDKVSKLASIVKKTAVQDDESRFFTMYSLTKTPPEKAANSDCFLCDTYLNARIYQNKRPVMINTSEKLVFEVYCEPTILDENKRNDCLAISQGKKYEFAKEEGEQKWKTDGPIDKSLDASLDFILNEMSTSSKDNPLLKSHSEADKYFKERIKIAESKNH